MNGAPGACNTPVRLTIGRTQEVLDMAFNSQYTTTNSMDNENRVVPFKDSAESALRKLLRDAVRNAVGKGHLTRAQRDVTAYLVNLWHYHKGGPRGYMAPGHERIAFKARVSVRTSATTVGLLVKAGVLTVVGCPTGGKDHARLTLDIAQLLAFCGCEIPAHLEGKLRAYTPAKTTPEKAEIACVTPAKIACGEKVHIIDIYTNVETDFEKTERFAKVAQTASAAIIASLGKGPIQQIEPNEHREVIATVPSKLWSWTGKEQVSHA
jgi:hypothetical protein